MGDKRVGIACDNCGKTDTYPAHQAETRRFCSVECIAEWQSEHVTGETHPNWKGEENQRKPSEISEHNFCDQECKAEWQTEAYSGSAHPNNTRELVECTWCGDHVDRPRWQREQYNRHFCDDECRWAYFSEHRSEIGNSLGKVEFSCDYCGDVNERIPVAVGAYEHTFYDRDCRAEWFSENMTGEDHPNWKGGVGSYYGGNWNRQRRKVRKRDNYECCCFCGISDGASKGIHGAELHIDHMRRKAEFSSIEESNSLSNLLTVGTLCHQRIF